MEAEKQLGVKVTELDNLASTSAQQTALENLARADQLVLMQGGISAATLAPKFPNTQFVVFDGTLPPASNTHSVIQNWLPVTYLAGVAAATESKSHVIGYVGGIPIPIIIQSLKGYTEGAKSVDPSIKVVSANIGSFTDSAKAKSAAAAQIAQGADVIMANLDSAHEGVVQAAEQAKGVKVIGSVAAKCGISDGLDIGDSIFNETKLVDTLITNYVHTGKLPATSHYGLAGGFSNYQLCSTAPPKVKAAVAKAKAAILAGKVTP